MGGFRCVRLTVLAAERSLHGAAVVCGVLVGPSTFDVIVEQFQKPN